MRIRAPITLLGKTLIELLDESLVSLLPLHFLSKRRLRRVCSKHFEHWLHGRESSPSQRKECELTGSG
jgi:hypothetical protein